MEYQLLIISENSSFEAQCKESLSSSLNINFFTSNSPQETLTILKNESIDCILTFHNPPGIDGLLILEAVRAKYSNIPILLVTQDGDEELASDAIGAGVTEYLIWNDNQHTRENLLKNVNKCLNIREHAEKENINQSQPKIILNTFPDPAFIIHDQKIQFVNKKGMEMLGMANHSEYEGEPFQHFIETTESTDLDEYINNIEGRKKEAEQLDVGLRALDIQFPARMFFSQLVWNNHSSILCLIRDISESRELYRSLIQFRRAVESAGHAVYFTTEDGTISYVNPAFEKITGYQAEDAIGKTPNLLNSGEMNDDYFSYLWETIESGDQWEEEIVNRRKNGELYYADQTISPIECRDGEVEGFVAVQNDITQRRKIREELNLKRHAIEEAPVGISITNATEPDNPLIFVNRAFENLTHYSSEEILGQNCRFLQGEETDPERVHEIRKGIENKETFTTEILNYRKDGTPFWNELTISPLRNEEDEVTHFLGFQRDITDRIENQQKRENLLEERTVLIQEIHHRVKNNLQVISGLMGLQKRRTNDRTTQDALENAQSRIQTMATVHKALFRGDEFKEIKLSDYSRDIVKQVTRLSGGSIKNINFEIESSDEMYSIKLTKAVPIGLVINELVSNSIQYARTDQSPDVSITLDIKILDDDSIQLVFRDNGPGFDESFSWDDEDSLGLTLVRNLVENQLNGEMEIFSDDGVRFVLTIPDGD